MGLFLKTFLILVAASVHLTAQRHYVMEYVGIHDVSKEYEDSLTFAKAIKDTLSTWRADNYLLANLDTVHYTTDSVIASVYKGDRYAYGTIKVSDTYEKYLNAAGLRRYRWRDKSISERQISRYMGRLLEYFESNGYPFASSKLDSIHITDGKVDAVLSIDKGRLVRFDSLVLKGDLLLKESFLRQYLEIRKGDYFNLKRFDGVQKRLEELPFVRVKAVPRLRFDYGNAQVYLYADKKKNSKFDFLIGLVPTNENGERSFTVTGSFTGELHNRFGHGEYIFARFERLRPEVQELDVRGRYPYLAGLPLGISGGLKIYRRTIDFLEVEGDLGTDYQLTGRSSLQASWNFKNSRLIEIDTMAILSARGLPDKLDVQYQGAKLGANYQNLDYRWNPSSGLDLSATISIGQKSIIPNQEIINLSRSGLDFSSAYDSIRLKTLQLATKLDVHYYVPLATQITIQTRLRGGYLYNQDRVYENEYYRLGGNALIRGFAEQSIIAQGYGLLTIEGRLLLNQNSYLTLPFVDIGYTKVKREGQLVWDRVFGTGLAISFATPAGIFNVSFAVGSRLGNPLDFNATKVHFGYVNLF